MYFNLGTVLNLEQEGHFMKDFLLGNLVIHRIFFLLPIKSSITGYNWQSWCRYKVDFDFWNLVYWPLPRFLSVTSAKQCSWKEQSRPLWITDICENVYTTLSITVWTEFIGTAKRQHVCRCCLFHQMMLSENKLLNPAMDLSCKDPEGHLWVGTVASSFDGADVSLCNQYQKIMIFFSYQSILI